MSSARTIQYIAQKVCNHKEQNVTVHTPNKVYNIKKCNEEMQACLQFPSGAKDHGIHGGGVNSNDNHVVKVDFIKYSKNSTINQNIVNKIIFILLYYIHK